VGLFLIKRFVALIPVLLGVAIVTFCLTLLIPGDPVKLILGENASPESITALRHQLGLDQGFLVRFFDWVTAAVQGDFGTSIATRRSAADMTFHALGNTAILAGSALLISVLVGIPAGLVTAVRRGAGSKLLTILIVAGTSLPSFWLALLLLQFFALDHTWFPTGNMTPATGPDDLGTRLHHLVLPALAVAALPTSFIARLTRTLIVELLNQDFVLTLETRGFSRPRIWRHILRNAAPGTVNIVGLMAGDLVLGAVFVELVFTWPGIGTAILDAVHARDYPVIQAVVLVTGGIFAVITIFTDAIMRALDPRVDVS
jgi:peptide/nickel transport system permease protein